MGFSTIKVSSACRAGLFGVAALALAACGSVLDDLRASAPAGSAYQQAQYREYTALAEAEFAEEDFVDADYFGSKALASRTAPVEPDQVSARAIPAEFVDDLTTARGQLIAALTPETVTTYPDDAAAAVASFDCWLQEQEENFQPDDIAACRNRFMTALAAITAITELPGDYEILFAFDVAELSPSALAEVRDAAEAALASNATRIVVQGHTDRAGSIEYNQALSLARAQNTAAALVSFGIDAGVIRIRDFGESRPAVPTADGVREQANRRAVIRFNEE